MGGVMKGGHSGSWLGSQRWVPPDVSLLWPFGVPSPDVGDEGLPDTTVSSAQLSD